MSFPSSPSSHLTNLPEGNSGSPHETSIESDLARIAPITSEAVTKICAAKAEAIEGTIEEAT